MRGSTSIHDPFSHPFSDALPSALELYVSAEHQSTNMEGQGESVRERTVAGAERKNEKFANTHTDRQASQDKLPLREGDG